MQSEVEHICGQSSSNRRPLQVVQPARRKSEELAKSLCASGYNGMSFLLRWTGIYFGAVSLFSLMEQLEHFTLAPIFDKIVNYHRAFFYPAVKYIISALRWICDILHVYMPSLPLDIVILYVIFSAAIAQYTFNNLHSLQKQFGGIPIALSLIPLLIIWPLILIINTMAIFVSPKLGVRNLLFGWDVEIGRILGGCLTLVAANAYFLA